MTQDFAAAFPREFADLEHLAGWSLDTEEARNRHRLTRPYAEIKAFYDEMLPRAETILAYLNGFPLEGLPPAQTRLLNLVHALADAGPPVEWWQDVTYSKGFDPHRLLIHQ